MKDVIPAGKGMQDVQLLVVNRFDRSRLCSIGELGELYVRAGGLAEGYLDLPELNQSKFVKNWFVEATKWVDDGKEPSTKVDWKGTRDRLYSKLSYSSPNYIMQRVTQMPLFIQEVAILGAIRPLAMSSARVAPTIKSRSGAFGSNWVR